MFVYSPDQVIAEHICYIVGPQRWLLQCDRCCLPPV